jgi:hypothetical protein
MINGYLPRAGDQFELMHIAGSFAQDATVSVEGVSDAWQFSQEFIPETGTLMLSSLNDAQPAPGFGADFNEDGVIDGQDLAEWTTGFGAAGSATHMQGDADGDANVEGADFLIWQRQFGLSVGSGDVVQSIPEPASGWLVAVSPLTVNLLRKRRRT